MRTLLITLFTLIISTSLYAHRMPEDVRDGAVLDLLKSATVFKHKYSSSNGKLSGFEIVDRTLDINFYNFNANPLYLVVQTLSDRERKVDTDRYDMSVIVEKEGVQYQLTCDLEIMEMKRCCDVLYRFELHPCEIENLENGEKGIIGRIGSGLIRDSQF